ncbi:MAG: dipicolinate synthase subunit B [Oscillospiraceae bacterium]|jgi:dipicolinate synthase subunit B|nr:dipicolinate synthase subunit B [Oscillospiraceae bacterium]
MIENSARVGYAMCGSFCTMSESINALEILRETFDDITPIMSEIAFSTDTRFGRADEFVRMMEHICGKSVIHTIADAEPIGPKALLDLLIIAPATGNTVSKIANGITDTAVTMAAKAHLRNGRPMLLAICSNDALSGSAPAIGTLLSRRNVYFAPMYQDDPIKKPTSLVADFGKITQAAEDALRGRQLQPLLAVR